MSLVSPGSAEPYRRLAEIFHDVLSEQDLDALLERIADALAELIPYEDVHIYEADEAKRELVPVLARSKWADEVMRKRFSFGEGITGWAVERREPVLANQAHLDPRVRFVPGTPTDPEALIAVPLVARGRLKGTLNIYRIGEDAAFTEEEFLLATRFGDAAALALDNAHIRARLEHQASTDALTGLYNHRTFHDRLKEELTRASAEHSTVALVMLDLDDFKKVNDIYGHGVGDQLLVQVAGVLQASVRTTDAVCRIGGEEFAIILPSGDAPSSVALAERMRQELAGLEAGAAGTLTVSTGIAVGPEHAANPRELVACAEAAMMTAKSRGDGLVVVFEEATAERPSSPGRPDDDVRSIAHLNLLQSLSGKLVRLNDVHQIGVALADELRLLIDYHNCRVFLRDGDDLVPIAFRGDLTTAEPGISAELLPTKVGRGVTGRVAETGVPLLVGDAAACEFGERIAGTAEIEESLLVVPLTFGAQVTGVIVVSKLGLDQFDADDLRLLVVVAGHASSALENARLYDVQRREAEGATALLELGRELASARGLLDVARRLVDESARILSSPSTTVLLEHATTGELVRLAEHDDAGTRVACGPVPGGLVLDSWLERGEPFVAEAGHPILTAAHASQGAIAVAPFKLDGRRGAIATTVPFATGSGRHELELLGGIALQARIALENAEGDESLERMFLSTVEALVTAVEESVDETSGHARTIADLSLRVGLALGLGPAALRRLELSALLHDVGKLGIPPAILRKPGPLTEAERAVVEQHPVLGERMLERVTELEHVRRVVRSAHEHFDGSGYPDRLAGEDIPIESRIVLVCDTYDAMTTNRPYRSSLGRDEARSRLRAGAGSQFDPAVVEALLRVLEHA